jgi:hypothetical protein
MSLLSLLVAAATLFLGLSAFRDRARALEDL